LPYPSREKAEKRQFLCYFGGNILWKGEDSTDSEAVTGVASHEEGGRRKVTSAPLSPWRRGIG